MLQIPMCNIWELQNLIRPHLPVKNGTKYALNKLQLLVLLFNDFFFNGQIGKQVTEQPVFPFPYVQPQKGEV